jgi:Aspartyl protease
MITKRCFLASVAALPFWPLIANAGSDLLVQQNRLFLDVRVNGHPVQALLDSAAETSFIDTGFARTIGVVGGETVATRGSGGDTDAQLVDGVYIEALGLRLGPLTVALLDLSDVGRRLLKGPLSFVMGRELFDAARLSIDIERVKIHVMPPSSAPSGVRVELREERGIETLPVSIEGHPPVQAAFDLGNGREVLVGAEYAQALGLLTDGRTIGERNGGGIGGERPRQTFMLKSLNLAEKHFVNVRAAIDATGSATKLNVGVSILRNFQLVTDFTAHAVWLKAR